jgi:hypothetical protein
MMIVVPEEVPASQDVVDVQAEEPGENPAG